MDLSNPVLSGLIRKRQELAANLDAARVRPARRAGEPRHETTRQVLRVLRESGEAMSHRDITLAIMRVEGRDMHDRKVVEVMCKWVADCVRRLVRQGAVVKGEAAGGVLRWGIKSSGKAG